MILKQITSKALKDAACNSKTFSELCSVLQIQPTASNNKKLSKRARKEQINIHHLYRIREGLSSPIALNDYLEGRSYISSFKLKLKLWEAGLKPKQCEVCGLTEWCGKPAPLALDHINGNNADNRLENLRILCHNCHAQTNTFAGRNQKTNIARPVTLYLKMFSPESFIMPLSQPSSRSSRFKIKWPSATILADMVAKTPLSRVGKLLGVSGNAIRKRCRKIGILIPDHRHKMVQDEGVEPFAGRPST